MIVLDWSNPEHPEGVTLEGRIVARHADGVDVEAMRDGEALVLRFGRDGWAADGLFSVAQTDLEAA